MAEALVTVLLERLGNLALDKVGGEFKLFTEVEKDVKSLTSNLEAIKAVLEDAEQRQVKEATVRRWLAELSKVSNDMDNVLDEWITRAGMRQMEKQEKHALTFGKKVRSSASSFFSGSKLTQLVHNRDIAVRIKELSVKIDLIAKEKHNFSFQNFIRVPSDLPERQKTTSLPNVKTFGRDHEKELIISKLLSEGSEGNQVPLIIPIVGMGGMGKTSLVNLVYNDEKIKSHFDKKIWVCVSDPFEEIKISKAILEGLGKDNTSNELQTLMKNIDESIQGKKFLFVLDDVWSPNLCQWEELIKPLRNGIMGSRVLVTTRNEEVATLMEATTQMIPLKGLGEAFCLSLFYYYAKIDEGSVPKEIQDIALDIVKKCNGLPLAAKTLGSLMRSKKKIQKWRAILTNKTWELKEIQQDVFRPLLLSYHDLTPATKRCLLYCAAFPKDYVFDKTCLIELWMSQDYLREEGSKGKMTIIGQDIFDDLVMRSFFQDVEVNEYVSDILNRDISCKIHDIVHDFLQYLTKNDGLVLDFELDACRKREVLDDKFYHLTLVNASEVLDSFISFLPNCKRLRTLTVIDASHDFLSSIFELIIELKFVRTLNLCEKDNSWSSFCLREIPKGLGGLMHLRFLNLSYNMCLKELPDTMVRLYNLQTLRLVDCQNLKKLDVGSLINLRHLYVKDCPRLKLIKGIEKLKDLQTLDEFRVEAGDERNKLEDLKDLNQLQGVLDIYIRGKPNVEEKAIMVSKVHLSQLKLNFDLREGEDLDREIMDNLEPHPNLESLSIYGYHGLAFSHWLSALHCLRVLTLSMCNNTVLPPLGKLASLESLNIGGHHKVEKVGIEFLGIESSYNVISFPKLQKLIFTSMNSWEEWEGVDNNNITIMPCLSEFSIQFCFELKALPDFLWKTQRLQKLVICSAPILINLYRQGVGEDWAKISHIPTIEMNGTEILKDVSLHE